MIWVIWSTLMSKSRSNTSEADTELKVDRIKLFNLQNPDVGPRVTAYAGITPLRPSLLQLMIGVAESKTWIYKA